VYSATGMVVHKGCIEKAKDMQGTTEFCIAICLLCLRRHPTVAAKPCVFRQFIHSFSRTDLVVMISYECRVPMPPGTFWISFCTISRPLKVLENGFGPGNFRERSWKVLEFYRL